MKVEVDESLCISCGYCASVCPKVFEVEDVSHVKVDTVPKDDEEAVKEAIEGCPTEAIKEINE